jgi:signal transduction histidine kinase
LCELLEWSLSKMEQVTGEPGSQDLAEFVGQSVNLLSGVAEDNNVGLVSDVPEIAVQADRHIADTVIRKLLTNAITFTEVMGIVTISAEDKNGLIEIAVTDTGLGLLLCKDSVERQGGMIDVESKPGEVPTFSFTLLPIYGTSSE